MAGRVVCTSVEDGTPPPCGEVVQRLPSMCSCRAPPPPPQPPPPGTVADREGTEADEEVEREVVGAKGRG